MTKDVQVKLLPQDAFEESKIRNAVARELNISPDQVKGFRLLKRSIDARKKPVHYLLRIEAGIGTSLPPAAVEQFEGRDVRSKPHVLIIGSGPAGLFAALSCIEKGVKPVILERGKDVRQRRRDLAVINKEHIVNPDSNYCFGEGGAGTYSDGKLYTRSKKRGDVHQVLKVLVQHGASADILVDAHPHIGTNKLPKVIVNMRETILNAGGEIHFNKRVTGFDIASNTIKGITTADGDYFSGKAVILATGHSARDIYSLLDQEKIGIELKPFALGVRVEHPQQLIDQIQYGTDDRGDFLPPASYSLVHQSGKRGVYSFCMCPGGIIAPCATSQEEVVTNGWSPSKRNNPYANSGVVVQLFEDDFKDHNRMGALAGMAFQKSVEKACWTAGGRNQTVPAQRMVDFVNNKVSTTLPTSSYQPGIKSTSLEEVIPLFISSALKEGFKAFGKKMKGYFTNEAVVHAVESRTSSPVRIPRDHKTLEHIQIKGFYPCGEGAGYAGGIVSAAIDGIKCAEQASARVI